MGSAVRVIDPLRSLRRMLLGLGSTILAVVIIPVVLIVSVASRMEQVTSCIGTLQMSSVSSYGTLDIEGCRVTALSYFTYYESHARYDAVLGGRERGCCGAYQFHYRYELQPFIDYVINQDPLRYAMLVPYGSASTSRESLKDNAGLAAAWQQASAVDPDGFRSLQDRYVYETKWIPIKDFHSARGLDLDSRPDVIKGLILSIHNRMGLETNGSLSIIIRSGVTNSTSDVDFITKLCDTFGAAYPGTDIYERYCVDYSEAACGSVCEKTMAINILNGEYSLPVSFGIVDGVWNDDSNASLETEVNFNTSGTVGCVKVVIHGINSVSHEANAFALDIVYGPNVTTHDHCYIYAEGIWGAAAVPGPTGKHYQLTYEHEGNLVNNWVKMRVSWWADGTVRAFLNDKQVFEDRCYMIPGLFGIEASAMSESHKVFAQFRNVRCRYSYKGKYGTRGYWSSSGYYGLTSVQTGQGMAVDGISPYSTGGLPTFGVSAFLGGTVNGAGGYNWDTSMSANGGRGVPISSFLTIQPNI